MANIDMKTSSSRVPGLRAPERPEKAYSYTYMADSAEDDDEGRPLEPDLFGGVPVSDEFRQWFSYLSDGVILLTQHGFPNIHSTQSRFPTCPQCPGAHFNFNHISFMESHYWEAHAKVPCLQCKAVCNGRHGLKKHEAAYHPLEYDQYHIPPPKPGKKGRNRGPRTQREGRSERINVEYLLPGEAEERRARAEEKARHTPPKFYEILGLEKWASLNETRARARKLRIACHPDRLKRQEGLTHEQLLEIDERAKNVGWAAETLCNPAKKEKYDQKLARFEDAFGPIDYDGDQYTN